MSSGHVNIGTGNLTQSDRMLNVYGGRIRVEGITTNSNTAEFYGNTTSGQSYGLLVSSGTTSGDQCAQFRSAGGTNYLKIRGDGKVSIGNNTSPDGMLHIWSATAGSVNTDADADELTLESSGNTGMSILSPGTGESSIYFGNPGTNGQKDGWLKYYHETHSNSSKRRALQIKAGGGEVAYFNSTGLVMSNDKGISFVNADDTASNETVSSSVLDDYEEGDWTPSNAHLSVSSTYSARYVKVGKIVHLSFAIMFASSPSDTAQTAWIDGLPFQSHNKAQYVTLDWIGTSSAANYRNTNTEHVIFANSNRLTFYYPTGAHAQTRSHIAGKQARGTFTYLASA